MRGALAVAVGLLLVGSAAAAVGVPKLVHVPYRYEAALGASASMEPTVHCALRGNSHCQGRQPDLVLLADSGSRSIEGGDIVAYRNPLKNKYCPGSGLSLHRIVGLPGERVVERRGVVWINGKRLYEPYVPVAERGTQSGSWLVPPRSYFILGDDRAVACDSSLYGPVLASQIVERVVEIIRPSRGGSEQVGPPIVHVSHPYSATTLFNPTMLPTIDCPRSSGFKECTEKLPDLVLLDESGPKDLQRGEVIQFRLPAAAKRYCGTGYMLARLVGLSGDRIRERRGYVSVNGEALHEPYVAARNRDGFSGSWRVPAGEGFVLSDNRAISCDSRLWGPLRLSNVVAQVVEVFRPRQPGS